MKKLRITLREKDAETLVQVISHIINENADTYDKAVLQVFENNLIYKIRESNK